MTPDNNNSAFGIYIHWPFCKAKCPYCDFNSHVVRDIDHDAWRDALRTALARGAEDVEQQPVTSVFFGGGTPSLMAPATAGALLSDIAALFPSTDDMEVTLEANPTSVEAERFKDFRAAGVNRVSVGVQALNDDDLRFLGRQHSVAEALDAVALARETFPRVSFDLIYARPKQTLEGWTRELGQALALSPDHLSLYQLTIEPGTAFGDLYARGRLATMEDDRAAELYEATQEICGAAGLPAYEVSNHARPGAECRHNLVYWHYHDYLGIGPGAHGRIGGRATAAYRDPKAWLSAVVGGGAGYESEAVLSTDDLSTEYLLMSLRLAEGTSLARYRALKGAPLSDARIAPLIAAGLLFREGDALRARPEGRLVLNRVIAELLD